MNDTYLTIGEISKGLYKDKGSKFIAIAYPVISEEEIKTNLSDLQKEYYDARHICYAWQLNPDKSLYRVNDDGEPSGTAGKPIFAQIQSHQLTNILIAVIRYFGGTLLGTAGLAKAYRLAAKDALNQAKIIEQYINTLYRVSFPFEAMNNIMKIVKDYQIGLISKTLQSSCFIDLSIRKSFTDIVLNKFRLIESINIELLDHNH